MSTAVFSWKCPSCQRTNKSPDDVAKVICKNCQKVFNVNEVNGWIVIENDEEEANKERE